MAEERRELSEQVCRTLGYKSLVLTGQAPLRYAWSTPGGTPIGNLAPDFDSPEIVKAMLELPNDADEWWDLLEFAAARFHDEEPHSRFEALARAVVAAAEAKEG